MRNADLVREAFERWNRHDHEWVLGHVDPGKVTRFQSFFSHEEALTAGGIS
jgi:hypothetical protein